MTTHATSDERMLKLRLAARALVEWKEPPTSPRYKQVVEELISVHPFAARVGFHPDKPAFRHDTRGVVLWYLSETLDDVDALPSPPQAEYNKDEKLLHLLGRFREDQVFSLIDGLRSVGNEKIGYGLTVFFLLRYVRTTISSDWATRREHEYVNNLLVLLIDEDRRTRLDLLKGLAAVAADIIRGRKEGWSLLLYRTVLTSPFTFSLPIVALWGGVFMIMKALSFPTWAVWATGALFFVLLADSLTTRKIYYLLRNSSLEFRLRRWRFRFRDERLPPEGGLRAYAYYLMLRCFEEEAFLPTLLRDETGRASEAILSLLGQYSREGVESVLGLLADPEISMQGRARIFAWLCRVIILPKERLIDIPLREYLKLHLA